MARKTKDIDDSDKANVGHNAGERAKIMRSVAQNIMAAEDRISVIREEIAEERGRIKSLDIRMTDFNTVMRLMRLEEADKDKALDGLREAFAALMPNEQIDWIRDGVGEPEQPVGPASAAGETAGKAGKARANPYPPGTPAAESYDEAYDAAQAANRAGLGGGADQASA